MNETISVRNPEWTQPPPNPTTIRALAEALAKLVPDHGDELLWVDGEPVEVQLYKGWNDGLRFYFKTSTLHLFSATMKAPPSAKRYFEAAYFGIEPKED